MKERFTTEPVLVTPDLDKEMRVEADASDFATGGVLSMKCEDERWRPVCYDSKLKGLSDEQTLVLSDTRELDRVPNTT